MPDEHVPVLIAGGGYAGLTLSLFLTNLGVPSLLVDRHPGVSIQGRARGINPRTMEIYRPLGIADAVREAGKPFQGDSGVATCQTLAGEWNWIVEDDAPAAYPEWTAGEFVMADQSSVEPILIEAARSRGARQLFNTQLVSFDARPNGITAVVEDRASGERRTVGADYLVAADGTHSSIREALGIARPGFQVSRTYLNVLFEADLSDIVKRRALFWIIFNQEIGLGGGFVTTATPDRWGLSIQYDPSVDAFESFTEERCLQAVRAYVGRPDLAAKILDIGGWQEGVGVAERYRSGRVLLAGDSAHVWPPAGAMGANSAVQDAHNLAWKLAAVVGGWAGDGLLDSYEAERRPVALALSDLTVRRQMARFGQGKELEDVDDLVCILGQRYESTALLGVEPGTVLGGRMEAAARPGFRAPHLWLEQDGRRVALHDLATTSFVLLTGPDGGRWVDAASRASAPVSAYRVGADLLDVEGGWARLGLGSDGAVLIRPDGYVAWCSGPGAPDPGAALRGALERILGRAV